MYLYVFFYKIGIFQKDVVVIEEEDSSLPATKKSKLDSNLNEYLAFEISQMKDGEILSKENFSIVKPSEGIRVIVGHEKENNEDFSFKIKDLVSVGMLPEITRKGEERFIQIGMTYKKNDQEIKKYCKDIIKNPKKCPEINQFKVRCTCCSISSENGNLN